MKVFVRNFFIGLVAGGIWGGTQAAIKITEIDACASGDGEWIELFNDQVEAVDVTGWKFYEQGVRHGLKPESHDLNIPAQSYAVIVDKEEAFRENYDPKDTFIIDSSWGSLHNQGERLELWNQHEEIQYTVDYKPCTKGKSWQWDGSAWKLFPPTPGYQNQTTEPLPTEPEDLGLHNVEQNQVQLVNYSLAQKWWQWQANQVLDFAKTDSLKIRLHGQEFPLGDGFGFHTNKKSWWWNPEKLDVEVETLREIMIVRSGQPDLVFNLPPQKSPKIKTWQKQKWYPFWSRNQDEWVVRWQKEKSIDWQNTTGIAQQVVAKISEISPNAAPADWIELIREKPEEEKSSQEGFYPSLGIRSGGVWRWWGVDIPVFDSFLGLSFGKNAPLPQTIFAGKTGFGSGKGIVELVRDPFTENETILDVVCWGNPQDFSRNWHKVLARAQEQNHWRGQCWDESFDRNQSLAREDKSPDTNTALEWQTIFGGSLNRENISNNQPPRPVIKLQSPYLQAGPAPLRVNFDGRLSTDPDGKEDIADWWWEHNSLIFARKSNPGEKKLYEEGEHIFRLCLTDRSGAHRCREKIIRVGNLPPEKEPPTVAIPATKTDQKNTAATWFAEFWQHAPNPLPLREPIPPAPTTTKGRISPYFFHGYQPEGSRKNL